MHSASAECCGSYDTSELFIDKDKSYLQFRVMKQWDVNVRKKFWNFWSAILKPEDADEDLRDDVRATQSAGVVPFEFDTYDDGTPILVDQENGDKMQTSRKQQVFRQYLRIHYRTFTCSVFPL